MVVNRQAPIVAASEIEVAADPETVWDVLAAIDRWPDWNPDIKAVTVDGPLTPGAVFRWKSGPATITSTIERAERPRLIAWTGRALGLRAGHEFRLEPRDGATLVRTEESFDGPLARVLRGRMRTMLQEALDGGLRHLKTEAERRRGA